MSLMRHHRDATEPLVRGYAVTHPSGTIVLPQGAGWDQLVYAARGVMTVHTAAGVWVVPPHRAVWVPAGIEHRIVMSGQVAVRTLYLATELAALPAECRAVNVPALLRELILHAVRRSPLDPNVPRQARLLGVLIDELAALPAAPLQLPTPRDARARAVADALAADVGADQPIGVLAAAAGASRRTVERLFATETGMSVGQWRQRCRLVEALRLLAEGMPVTAVAHRVGYATPSAFGAMFRAELGVSPGRYFAPH
jgi:AraC-like DNA-binding protein